MAATAPTVESPNRVLKRYAITLVIFAASCGGWWLLTNAGKLIPEWIGIPFMLGLFVTTFGCGAIARRIFPVIVVPIDRANWNKTTDELWAEYRAGKRATVTQEELALAQAYELANLPAGTIFPAAGQVWEAQDDAPVNYTIWYKAPYSDGGNATLPAGARLIMAKINSERSTLGVCSPEAYDEMEVILIPESTRKSRKYNGYTLGISTAVLNRSFRLIETRTTVPTAAPVHDNGVASNPSGSSRTG